MSSPTLTDTTVEALGVEKSFKYSIRNEDQGILCSILRNQVYSNKPAALLREYSTNACDAHIEKGTPDRPIRVTLPTVFEPTLKIRDFGPGLSVKQIEEVFCFYGNSTKRNDQKQTGQLGIGSKSGFCYCDTFVVISYQNGKQTFYNCHLDESNQGSIDLFAEQDTTEEDGLEINIPIKQDDIWTFQENAKHIFRFFSVKPEILGVEANVVQEWQNEWNKKPLYSGEGWEYVTGNSYAVMGNIAYRIDSSALPANTPKDVLALCNRGFILYYPMNALDFAASREVLQYTDRTKKALIEKMNQIIDNLAETVSSTFANAKTMFEAKVLYGKTYDLASPLYPLREIFSSRLKWNGKDIGSDIFSLQTFSQDKVAAFTYSYTGGRRPNVNQITRIRCSEKTTYVIDDIADPNDKKVFNRFVKPLVENNSEIVLVRFLDDATQKEVEAAITLDFPYKKLSDFPKMTLTSVLGKANPNYASVYSPKHSHAVFQYNVKGASYRSKASDAWEMDEDFDIEKDEGVYLIIERYEYRNSNGYLTRPHELDLSDYKNFGIKIPVIYGVKAKYEAEVKANPKMVSLWDYLKGAVVEKLKKDNADQIIADTREFNEHAGNYKPILDFLAKNLPTGGVKTEIHEIVEKVNLLNHKDSENYVSMARRVNYTLSAKPAVKIDGLMKKVIKELPLLSKFGQWDLTEKTSEFHAGLKDYLDMVMEKICSRQNANNAQEVPAVNVGSADTN